MSEEELKKKEFQYKGQTLDELQKLDVREFAKLVGASQRRAILRNFQEHEDFINRMKTKLSKSKTLRTHKRSLVIVPQMVGMRIGIYNGHEFTQVEITGEMLGHKLGEFSLTRGRIKHSKAGVGATKGSKSKSKK